MTVSVSCIFLKHYDCTILIDVTVFIPERVRVAEGSGTLQVCAFMFNSEPIQRDFTIYLTTVDGTGTKLWFSKEGKFHLPTALAGSDYVGVASEQTFTYGSLGGTTRCLDITLLDNEALEESLTFSVVLFTIDPHVALGRTTTTIAIMDDDGMFGMMFFLPEFTYQSLVFI